MYSKQQVMRGGGMLAWLSGFHTGGGGGGWDLLPPEFEIMMS